MKKEEIKTEIRRKLDEAIVDLAKSSNRELKKYYEGKVDGLMLALDYLEP